ncbi:MAG: 50S ribosomal protein L28, partial [Patescibacteria group bacterium]|nr:50S ribosomal protein L28 [Patescibacteria group bacterium]
SPMARACAVTGKTSLVGGRYSNRTRATQYNPGGKVRRKANLQKHKIFVPELGKHVSVVLSARAVKTIAKRGAYQTLKKAGVI